MKNKKGFTLVELLAVIVVLAIIMVIAATSVTSAMKSAAVGAFANAHKMLTKDIKQRIVSKELGGTAQITCNDETPGSECYLIYEYSKEDYEMEVAPSGSNYVFSLAGKGKFAEIESDKVIGELSEGVKEFELEGGKEELVLAFDSNANVITDEAKLNVVLEDKIKEESKAASFAYFDLLKEAAKIIRESLEAGNPLANEYKINDNVVARTDMGRCNGAKISIRFYIPNPGIDESAEVLGSFDFNTKPTLFDNISIENYKKVDLKYLPEYKSMPGNENIHLPYRKYSYGTTIRKWVAYCYTDFTYEVTQPDTKDYINYEDPNDIFKSYRTIDLENKVLKDLQ